MHQQVAFDPPAKKEVRNFLTGETFWLRRADCFDPTPSNLSEIVRICNEPEVFSWLFAEMFADRAYALPDASAFVAWAGQGWKEKAFFVFFVVTQEGRIAAACDIKSNRSAGSEIGYWASASYRGIMTNAVAALCTLAAKGGFVSLAARTKKHNQRSARVLTRAGFTLDPAGSREPVYDRFERALVASE